MLSQQELELWRYCGAEAFLEGRSQPSNPGLEQNPRDTPDERAIKRDQWSRGYSMALAVCSGAALHRR